MVPSLRYPYPGEGRVLDQANQVLPKVEVGYYYINLIAGLKIWTHGRLQLEVIRMKQLGSILEASFLLQLISSLSPGRNLRPPQFNFSNSGLITIDSGDLNNQFGVFLTFLIAPV
jgi:hypothetical protein